MKKLIIKSVIMVVIMLGISNYVLYIMTGKTPFNEVPDISISAPSKDDISRTLSGGKETVYKWTDEHGKVHYSSEPPTKNSIAKKMEVDPNTNLIQGIEVASEEVKSEAPQAVTNPIPNSVYSPQAVQKLIKDAHNVQNLLNERNEATKKALEDL